VALRLRKNYISLRLVLISWFVFFSIVPLVLVTWYSFLKFEIAFDKEQIQRLNSNAREIEVMFSGMYNRLIENRDELALNSYFTYNVMVADDMALRDFLTDWLQKKNIAHVSIYNRDGKRLAQSEKEYYSSVELGNSEKSNKLNAGPILHLENKDDFGVMKGIDFGIELTLVSKLQNSNKKIIGYLEQKILLKQTFINSIKNELKLEMLLANENHKIVNGTIVNYDRIGKSMTTAIQLADPEKLFEVKVNNLNYAFIVYPILWDQSPIRIIVGTPKRQAQALLDRINVAFLWVIGIGILILIIIALVSSFVLLKPLNKLIDGIRAFEETENLVQVRVKNRTEIGLLISTFNQMSLKVYRARNDLKKKIKELELANQTLRDAQNQLVQSAKMTSLGQLVAGVAHELNNPIGFIYSNTAHLTEQTEKLFKIIEEIQSNPKLADQIKKDYEFEYIKEDLPRLIKSYQEGAQRTRDIVLGLRNFSRIEESQLKEVDINQSLDMTLELLKGEIKNRITVFKEYESLPLVHCYASQINQVFMNILSNATQAISETGEIRIRTSLIPSSSNAVGKVRISIQDNGAGMTAEVVEKIFEPFFTTKEIGKGTGLGLSISYGIIQNHGGDIKVNSKVGFGSEFVLSIPITQPEASNKINISK
jgi:two-component system NtrC family sensor kinase